ncbi:hypothetical protein GCM10009069_16430 [Algimonas arctica]|uniref:CopC domain-containing protein n=1 Tax=Algimonas arctica TaxID=1479486 RepID=A0A8J3G2B4_9PROT|nr:copper resistance CopC family protein [Algimonas arctica]GHA94023.1 hypothetical protein GCM10009069_16430 [Algimonas arctica]
MKHYLIGLTTLGLITSLPLTAHAHTVLASSNIEAGASMVAAPNTLDLTFVKSVGLAKLELTEAGSDTVLDLTPERTMAKTHRVDLPSLEPGNYTIQWRAVASDGHVMTGEIAFTIAA